MVCAGATVLFPAQAPLTSIATTSSAARMTIRLGGE
jgi:hypothetical protein